MEQNETPSPGATGEANGKKQFEYSGTATSEAISGEVKIAVEEEGLTLTAPLDALHIPYADITAFESRDYELRIAAWGETLAISRVGNFLEGLYGDLYNAYNKKVRKALFIRGEKKFAASGEYSYSEDGRTVKGKAVIEVYEDSVAILPPDDGGRRIPLCFLNAFNRTDLEVSLGLNTGETYSFTRLGRDLEPFAVCVETCLRTMRDKSLKAIKELDGTLNPMQQQKIAKLMPEGVAVPMGRLSEISKSFAEAVEKKVSESRSAEEYRIFKKMCDPMKICVGVKSDLGRKTDNFIWMIAPGKKQGSAAVEFAVSEEESAATFLYSSFADWDRFWEKLNQAMEAIDFKRDVIRMTEEELRDNKNSDQAMAVNRNNALKFIRSRFTARAIHSTPESWEKKMLEHMG